MKWRVRPAGRKFVVQEPDGKAIPLVFDSIASAHRWIGRVGRQVEWANRWAHRAANR